MSDEQKISQRYRELAREEPPRHLDEAILAASRRAAETRPAPLVVPSGRQRWYFPLAAAAIIVLAVAVTLHVERQQDKLEVAEAPVAAPPPAREEKPAAAQVPVDPVESPRAFTPDPKPAPRRERSPGAAAESRELRAQRDAEVPADLQKAQKPAPPAAPAPQAGAKRDAEQLADLQSAQKAPAAPPQEARKQRPAATADQRLRDQDRLDSQRLALERLRREQERAAGSGTRAAAQVAAPATDALSRFAERSPEQWLQGIDDLKRQGRHEEAEKQLAEFRRRYPDYRIPEAITEKFEKR